ncbi:MAG: PQQ-like beta-propeller repeat protein [Candidatus Bathyarchaeota archaeon]|nr:MAG: PQQ-like beta-propeller repeat protein [Candidatus Bathyarchaeota archaeon]
MKIIKNIKNSTILSLILLLAISTTVVTLPAAFAQEKTRVTYAFIGATPNPVGVNQEVLLHVGITDYLLAAEDGFEGLTVTVEKPDGSSETLGPIRTDSTGGTGWVYVPTMTGTYYLQTNFPEQIYTWESPALFDPALSGEILYQASQSDKLEFVVQENPIEYYPGHSQPTEYWTRPIDSQLREWSTISGNWLTGAGRGATIAPYNDGPETAHILWTTELTMGGLAGGDMGEHGMVTGDAYEGKYSGSIIIGGNLYYNKFEAQGGSSVEQVVVAIDLHTGELLWEKTLLDNEQIEFGQTMYWDTMNAHGVYTYLWATSGSTWMAFDAQTGRWVYNMTDVPSGTRTYGPNGEILIYSVSNGVLTKWNSTAVYYNTLLDETDNYYYYAGRWRPQGRTFDASYGIDLTVELPDSISGSPSAYYVNDRAVGVSVSNTEVETWAVSLEPGNEGTLLYQKTWAAPADWASTNLDIGFATGSVDEGVFVLWVKETRQYYAFDINTGNYLWVTEPEHYMDSYAGTSYVIAYGNLYSVGYAGIVYCYDITTGNTEWTYLIDDKYNEILWSNGWPARIQFVTDGKLYIGMEEHSTVDPKPRGAPYVCLSADGEEVWRIDGGFRQTHWGGNSIIGDSIIAAMNTYDQQIYAIGKGATSITVSAPDSGVSVGSSATLKGSVMDVSPGTETAALKIRFPNGVPAISDKDMSEWMKYVYMQFEKPAYATGVTVTLEAIDPNGNYQYIGITTSDISGNYGFTFKPEIEGKYTIMATFAGSGGYYGSTTTTYLSVDPAASASTPINTDGPADATEPAAETSFISTEIAIIAAVAVAAVIGVAAYWFLKRK